MDDTTNGALYVSTTDNDASTSTTASVADAAVAADVVHTLALGIDDAVDDADDLLGRRHEELPAMIPTVPGTHPPASMSAVYRFYEVEATLSLKRREESSIAKCRLCREEGRQERKGCVRFSKSVTSNLWRHLKENHPAVYDKHAGEKKTIQMHKLVGKRGRKKKSADESESEQAQQQSGTPDRYLEDEATGASAGGATAAPRGKGVSNKRVKRQQSPVGGDAFFTEYALAMGGGGDKLRLGNLDRVREAAAFMCVYELLPFELCTSLALRNLLSECHVGHAITEDASVLASVFGRQAIAQQSRKLIDDVNERIVTQLKAVDAVHLQLTAWAPAIHGEAVSRTQFVGLFAVALDQDFNLVRRCLCAVPIGGVESSDSVVGSQLERSDAFQRALKMVAPHVHMATLAVVEPSRRSQFSCVLSNSKIAVLESITSLLRDIMVSTITGTSFTHPFIVGSESSSDDITPGPFTRVFDSTRFMEPSEPTGALIDDLITAEVSSNILTELPNVLTGHTIRDILLKVLHLVAHTKQSKKTRAVMGHIMINEFHADAETFSQTFERGPSSITVGVQSIYEVLSLTLKMMPTLQRYFELHKDGTSDLSKLMQLASLSAYEWERVGYLASLVKPFADAVSKLQEERFVTSSLIIPSVFTLLEKLRSPAEGESDLPEDMAALKNVAFANLSSTFGYLFLEPSESWSPLQRSSFNWLWSATLLDPRTRPFIIKGALTQAQFWEVVKAEASEIGGMSKEKDKENGLSDLADHPIALGEEEDHESNGQAGPNGTSVNGSEPTSGDIWDDLQANLASCAQEEMLLASSKSALELTKSNNLLEVEISFLQDESRISLKANPLDWWQNMRLKYPYVARLARFVLSVPGSPPPEDNPVANDSGLLGRLLSQMPVNDVSELVTASLNLRLEKHVQLEATTRQLWTTV